MNHSSSLNSPPQSYSHRDPALLAGMYFCYYFAGGPIQLVLRPALEAWGFPGWFGSALIGMLYLSYAAWRSIIGDVVHWMGLHRSLKIGAFGSGVVALAMLSGFRTWAILIAIFGWGFGSALLWSAGGAIALRIGGSAQRGRASQWISAATWGGLLIGATSLDLLPEGHAYRGAAFVGLEICWVGAGLIACALAWNLSRPVCRADPQPPMRLKAAAANLHRKGALRIFGLLMLAGGTYGMLYTQVNALIVQRGLTDYLGRLSLFFYVTGLLANCVVGRWSDRVGRRSVFLAAFLIGAFGFALLFTAALIPGCARGAGFVLIAGGCLGLGAMFASVQTVSLAWIGDVSSGADRPGAIGLVFIGRDLGVGLAGVGGAALVGQNLSPAASFALLGALMIGGLTLVLRLNKPGRER